MIARLTGACVRGLLVGVMFATPSLILPTVTAETAQIVAFLAIAGVILTTFEYGASSPCLFEFRDAAPFNRIRFCATLLALALMSLVARNAIEPSALTALVTSVGSVVGNAIDFPMSPLRLAVLMLPETASPVAFETVRASFGICLLVFLVSLSLFVVDLHRGNWPRRGTFNVWTNLPTFDPTRGGDVVARLDRDGRINITLGIILPVILPMIVGQDSTLLAGASLDDPQTIIWAIAIWGGLPFSLVMRGLAMQRIADIITLRRRESTEPQTGLVSL